MFLSIIIPVYKVEPYLRECLDSVAASPLDCWEAILVDDGSPDGCPQICDEYAARDSRFRVIHQENAGVAAARNAGLDIAQGEWIWFVDSDDMVDMSPVRNMLEWLRKNLEVDLVMFDLEDFNDGVEINICNNNDNMIVEDERLTKNHFLLRHNCYHHPRLWYKRKNVDKYDLRFTKGVKTGEDGEFMYKYMMLCKRPVKFGNTLYYYRQRVGSATNNINIYSQHIKDKIVIFNCLLSFMKEHQIQQEPWIEVRLHESMRNLLYAVFKTKQCHSNLIQKEVRDIMRNYSQSGYVMFNTFPHRIAFLSLVLYCFLLKFYFLFKGLK